MSPVYHFYIVSRLYVARVDEEALAMDTLQKGGTWLSQPDADAFDIMTDAGKVSEAEARSFRKK